MKRRVAHVTEEVEQNQTSQAMRKFMDAGGIQRLEKYFKTIGDILGNESRRGSFAIYGMGLLGDGERKSVEPIAARASPNPRETDAMHQRLLHFAVDSRWSDREVRRAAAQYAISAMTQREPVEAWIIDDTGFLKQGTHSVGVQRQYTGSAGKITNCQLGVSLSIATRTEHVPIDFELYLPKSWANNTARRREARIPEDVTFKTKPQLALQMIRRAVEDGVPKGILLADTAYGTSGEFRAQIRSLGLHYAVGVAPQTTISLLDNEGHPRGEAVSVKNLAFSINERGGFRRCTWREGTNEALWARFALRRVVAAGVPKSQQEPLWLLIEWRDGEPEPANYFLISLPRRMTKKQLIRLVMRRWRTERVYEDLKGELGLDHYEGRRFPGWHHHVSVALCCYAFIIAERVRHFPPSARGTSQAQSQPLAA
jgi:SRSO17 transposase